MTLTTKLLRRTLALLGASALLAASLPAAAQGTVTLSGAQGNTCQYSQMTVQPNGTIVVSCTGGSQEPTIANFYVSAPANGAPGSAGSATIGRSGGPAEALSATYSVGGSGCGASSGSVALNAGGAQTVAYTLGTSGTCSISITAPSGHTASPSSATVNVTTSTPENPNPIGCPAPEANSVQGALAFGPVDQLRLRSGVIASYPVIAPPDSRFASLEFTQGQQPNTPGGTTTEFSVSICRGAMLTHIPDCYYRSSQGQVNSNKITIYTRTKPEWGWNSQEAMSGFGCLADASVGQYFVNVRWTYASCVWGENNCGFSMQWAIGAW